MTETVQELTEALRLVNGGARAPIRPEPGVHAGVPYSDYETWDGINHSTLKWFSRSPAHARQYRVRPPEPSAQMALGSATHVAVLEPDRFPDAYARGIQVDRRYSKGKEAWARFQSENAGRIVLAPEEFDLCLRLREAVWSHPTAADILRGPGGNEMSAFWRDRDTGKDCRGRMDAIRSFYGWTFIVDLKTAADASPDGFSRAAARFSYAEQAAFYLDGLNALDERSRRFVHIAVEKEEPCAVAVYELDEQSIDEGRRAYRRHLKQYAECIETQTWGGYGDGILPLSLPRWSFKRED
jgi:exodeoxyribonuclease VIII